MKKRIYASICLCLLSLASCNDFLEENPRSTMASAAYYQTEEQATANVNFLYRNGAPGRISNAGSAYLGPDASIDGILTGYFSNSYEGQEMTCKYARLLTRQQNTSTVSTTVNDIWDPCYKAINVCNAAIKYIPTITMGSDKISQLVAEAKFFRAFNYFYLIKTFGDVPLTLEPYETLDNLYLERTPVATIYPQIESDLKEAVDKLPAVTFVSNGHRITKYVAALMLANVYMREHKYSDAAQYAKIVVNSPHKLTINEDMDMKSAFNKLRSTDDLDEVIYSQEFDATINNSSWWPSYSFNAAATALFGTYSIFERVYGPTNQFLNIYKKDDLRLQPNQFFQWEYTQPNTGMKWTSTTPCCWYYYDEEALLNTGKGTKDWNFFRYAEALLVAAESIAQSSGVTSEAAGYLALVKTRSDMNGKTVAQYTSELQGMSKDAFIQECWTERLREFPLEFKIWDDCTRTGMFPVISTTEPGKVEYTPLIGAKNGSGATFKESDLVWPISIDELQRNPKLVQNPGYE